MAKATVVFFVGDITHALLQIIASILFEDQPVYLQKRGRAYMLSAGDGAL
jgi:hypothetical protein